MDERYGDPERIVIDYLTPLVPGLPAGYETATVGVGLPDRWTTASPPHIGVFCDHVDPTHPLRVPCLMRLTTWADTPTKAKRLCRLAESAMLAHPGGEQVWAVRPGAGVVGGQDPDNKAPLATCTVTVELKPNY